MIYFLFFDLLSSKSNAVFNLSSLLSSSSPSDLSISETNVKKIKKPLAFGSVFVYTINKSL